MSWYLRKDWEDDADGIDAVVIHYTTTPRGEGPDWGRAHLWRPLGDHGGLPRRRSKVLSLPRDDATIAGRRPRPDDLVAPRAAWACGLPGVPRRRLIPDAALRSAGTDTAVVSTMDNGMDDRMVVSVPRLFRLAWVSPGRPSVDDLRHLLNSGYVGIKLHPAATTTTPTTPAWTRTCRRWPTRAVWWRSTAAQPNPIRTSSGGSPSASRRWRSCCTTRTRDRGTAGGGRCGTRTSCRTCIWRRGFDDVRWLVDEVGPERVVFGSDAAVDGPVHSTQSPADLAGNHNDNEYLILLAGNLDEHAARRALRENAMQLFGMNDH